MAGSGNVNRNLDLWLARKIMESHAAMDMHIKNSESYGKGAARWHDRTGSARSGITSRTDTLKRTIVSTIAIRPKHGEFLELSRRFHGAYRILEEARSYGLAQLLAHLRRIWRS